jgi:hypothetical protein
MPPEDCLENVGSHFLLKGKGNDHRCVVCEKKYPKAKKTGKKWGIIMLEWVYDP